VLADEPRAFWRMEETSGTLMSDSAENVPAGVLDGGANPNAPGEIGSGTGFDGWTGSANLGTVHTAEADWGWSWELWANVVALHDVEGVLLSCSNSPRWSIDPEGRIAVGMVRRSDLGWLGTDTGKSLPFDGNYHHLVLTVRGAVTEMPVVTMYIDGDLAYRDDEFGLPIQSPWSRGQGDPTSYAGDLSLNVRDNLRDVEGSYDEAAAYDYVLSRPQVKRHHQVAVSGK
jgi:hypothetical protein